MDALTITIPRTVHEPIVVVWAGQPLDGEPMGVTEIKALLAMALRDRVIQKRQHDDGGNFYGSTDPGTAL